MPDIAVSDAQRVFLYATAFALGMWLVHLLMPRIDLSLLPLAAVATAAGLVTVATLVTGDDLSRYVHKQDGTLRFPLG